VIALNVETNLRPKLEFLLGEVGISKRFVGAPPRPTTSKLQMRAVPWRLFSSFLVLRFFDAVFLALHPQSTPFSWSAHTRLSVSNISSSAQQHVPPLNMMVPPPPSATLER